MSTVGYATLQIIPSAKGMLGNLSKEVGQPLEKAGEDGGKRAANSFGATFRKVVVGLGLFKAVSEAFQFGKASIGAASELEQAIGKIDAVFGASAPEIQAWASTAADAFGQSTSQALAAAGTYGNLFQAFGIGQQPAKEMSRSLVELAADLAAFNDTSVDEALIALRSGLSGETEPLKRFGVAINDARLKQVAFEMGLISSVKEGLDPAAKAQAAYALIMRDTTLAQGAFTREGDSLSARQMKLSANWKNMQATVGRSLLPAVSALAAVLADKVIPAATKLAATWLPRIIAVGRVAASVLMEIGSALAAAFRWVIDNQPALTGFALFVGTVMVGAFAAWTASLWAQVTAWYALHAAQVLAMAKFVAIAAVIAALVAGIIWAYQNVDWFRESVNAVRDFLVERLWPALKSIASFIADTLVPVIVRVVEIALVPLILQLKAAKAIITDVVVPALQVLWSLIADKVIPVLQTIAGVIADVVIVQIKAWRTVIETVVGWLQTAWDKTDTLRALLAAGFKLAVEAITGAVDLMWQAVSTAAGWLQTAWDKTDTLRGLFVGAFKLAVDGVKAAFDGVVSVISSVVGWLDSAISKAQTLIGWIDKIPKFGVNNPFNGSGLDDMVNELQGRGKAAGGPVSAMRPYIVGERGWELFVPRTDGMILSHQASMRAVAGGSIQPVGDGKRTGVEFSGPVTFESGADVDQVMRVANFHLAAGG